MFGFVTGILKFQDFLNVGQCFHHEEWMFVLPTVKLRKKSRCETRFHAVSVEGGTTSNKLYFLYDPYSLDWQESPHLKNAAAHHIGQVYETLGENHGNVSQNRCMSARVGLGAEPLAASKQGRGPPRLKTPEIKGL